MEETFGINNVALVEGQPRTLGLLDLLRVYVEHRVDVVRRRSEFRRRKAAERLHLVEGLLTAILDIDEVIQLIRSSDDAAEAKARLIQVFDLSDVQATYILDMPLRRLTRLSRIELESERDELGRTIEQLDALLADDRLLRDTVSAELGEVAKSFTTPRRTVLLESAGQPVTVAAGALEVPDEPCRVLLSSTGLLARTTDGEPLASDGPRAKHDVVVSSVLTTARGDVGAVTSAGRVLRLGVIDLPALPRTATRPNLAGGAQLSEFLQLARGERVLALVSLSGPGIALGTEQGVVKRVLPDYPSNKAEFEVVRLEAGDRVSGAVDLADEAAELVFVTTAGQMLRFPARSVRPQGRAAAGMAGIRLGAGEQVVFFGAVDATADNVLVTVAGSSDALPGTVPGSAKVTPLATYPGKGRATGGVRCQRFLRGEDRLVLAWAGPAPGRAASAAGVPVQLPDVDQRRDASGAELPAPVAAVG
jgi:DNA gyrase subunit A